MKEPDASLDSSSPSAVVEAASERTFVKAFLICLLGGASLAASAGAQTISFSNVILDQPFPQSSNFFGVAVAGPGDLNGDGVPDVLVGAYGRTVNGNSGQGQAYVFSGADGSLLRTLNHPNPQAGAGFGYALAGVGDVSGDGTPDMVVAALYQAIGGNFDQGQAYLMSGADGSVLRTLDHPNPQASSFFGGTVAGVGDVNADGVPDVLVAASEEDVGATINQGRAYLFSGANGSLLRTLDDPNAQGQYFGDAMAGVGDVNGDGVPDMLVSAQAQDAGGNASQGRAFVFSGANGSLLRTLDHPNPQAHARFGFAAAGLGDVSGDGVPDFVVAAPFQAVSGNFEQGEAYVLGGADGSLLRTLSHPNPQAGANFGEKVAGIGDVDRDGIPDVLVAAPDQDVGGNLKQGRVYLFSGADGSLLRPLDDPSPQPGARFGKALSAVGEVNGDGAADLLVGAPRKNVGTDFNVGQAVLFVSVLNIGGQISINPGSATPTININGKGVITVGILSSTTFDATTIDVSTVRFGPAGALEAHGRLHREDLNGDGLIDAILHFRTEETGLAPGATQACIRFMTTGGQSFTGCAAIQTVP